MDNGSDLIAGIIVAGLVAGLFVYYRTMGNDEATHKGPTVRVAATAETSPTPGEELQVLRSIDRHLARVSRFITLLYWSAAISLVIAVIGWLARLVPV